MVSRTLRFFILMLALSGCALEAAFAQRDGEDLGRVMDMIVPGPEHDWLANLVGEWDQEMRLWMTPGADPLHMSGRSVNELVLGGRYLSLDSEGGEGPLAMHSLGMLGYDRTAQEYFHVGFDTMTTKYTASRGQVDAATGDLRLEGSETDPLTDEVHHYVLVIHKQDADTYRIQFTFTDYLGTGDEFTVAEVIATRAGS